MDLRLLLLVFAFVYFAAILALPVSPEKEKPKEKTEAEEDDLGLEYGRYLRQVVEALETDPEFAKKLENVSQEELKNGKIAEELDLVSHSVRTRLDELKRIEIERLRALAQKERALNNGEDTSNRRWRTLGGEIAREVDHLDSLNPHSFEAQDLQRLILAASKDLEVLDEKRRQEFKQYEMEKESVYREALINMSETQREEAIKKHDKQREHPRAHHPGSKKQLEQVWEETDKMPREEFNPKVFFSMHDINGDGFLDPQEVEAILTLEVKKLYSRDSDPKEMNEEFHRMREHIYREADLNKDGLISRKEFLDFTHRMEFERDEGWKGIEDEKQFTEEELKRFQESRHVPYQQHVPQQYLPEGYHPQQYQQHHYVPNPSHMTQEQWAAQQQYYQQQYAQQQYQMPNPGLHPNQQYVVVQQQPQLQGIPQQHHEQQQQMPQHMNQIPQQPVHAIPHNQQMPPQQIQQQIPQQVPQQQVHPNQQVNPQLNQHMNAQQAIPQQNGLPVPANH